MKYTITQSRLLYVLSIDDRLHRGFLKVGEVFVDNKVADSGDEQSLRQAVADILDQRTYMKGVHYQIKFVESTTYGDNTNRYRVDDVHRGLKALGIEKKFFAKDDRKKQADIWFPCTVNDVKVVIKRIKEGDIQPQDDHIERENFRPEQLDAIDGTVGYFKREFKDPKKGKRYLWNAKMRFGKTLCALEVAKECDYQSVLIVTHRPVVDKGWKEDFEKIFGLDKRYQYATRTEEEAEGEDFYQVTQDVDADRRRLVFFVSMQYLRLSKFVGGKERHEDPLKRDIMQYDWDMVIVDEAHEGIESAAGVRVMEKLKKDRTHILSLSGTPFNLLDKYDEGEIYTWDYVMEQRCKREWDDRHFGDPNPYADLPQMQILTFTLPKLVAEQIASSDESFHFHEFFKVWTEEDRQLLQKRINSAEDEETRHRLQDIMNARTIGRFAREGEVRQFIRKLRTPSDRTLYPFSTREFLDKFRHTFWVLPGVKEAKAMEQLLAEDKVFGKYFTIVNVAGDGNIEDEDGSAIKEVQKMISEKERTITLSCGKLTTGVSVPEWTAVLCMKGSENTPAANYMQTIFRVQTHARLGGRQKTCCYVFDFAPDRALTAVAETSKMGVDARNDRGRQQLKLTKKQEEQHLTDFVKLCPVLSMDEGEMGRHFSATQIFEKLNNVYIERAVRSGYSDNSIYDPAQLLDLTPEQEAALGDVHALIGSSTKIWKPEPINVNTNGVSTAKDAQNTKYIYYLSESATVPATPHKGSHVDGNGCPTTDDEGWGDVLNAPTPLFPYLFISHSDQVDGHWTAFSRPVLRVQYVEVDPKTAAEKEARDAANKEKRARMSVLRGVSIRIPLLVYGAEINDDEQEITVDNFTSLVDEASWQEFMPKGFTKKMFNTLKGCFDPSVFIGAAKRIRAMVKEADSLNTEDRIARIAQIFSYFHNPDKETVLTPWRVVNMQLSDCLGGYCFMNEDFNAPNTTEDEQGNQKQEPRFVDRGQVTEDVFHDYNARILEINSKTGLYPLYMAYSLFKTVKEPEFRENTLTHERGVSKNYEQYEAQAGDDLEIWKDVLQDNIFVVCRTPMAASITRRTLAGFRPDVRMNVRCYERDVLVDDLVSAGVLKRDDEHVSRPEQNYLYDGKPTKKCELIDVLRARPDLFEHEVVQGHDFWHVYNAITKKPKEDINNMKFSAIVGNPPYQLNKATENSTTNSAFASAIYPKFIDAACNIYPKYISLITPSRWLTKTGQGLSLSWVDSMINSNHFICIHDYANATECFDHVEIKGGINYFLYSEDFTGKCNYVKHEHEKVLYKLEYLNDKGLGIVLRDIRAADILDKVIQCEGDYFNSNNFSDLVSPQHFFDKNGLLTTSWTGYTILKGGEYNVKYYLNKNLLKSGEAWIKISDIPKNKQVLPLHKIYIPKVGGSGNDPYVLGKPFYGEPNSVCSQTYLVIGYDEKDPLTKEECSNIIAYIKTCFFRYLVSLKKKTQDNPSSVFQFVPLQDFSRPWTDADLYAKYHLTSDEIAYIERLIKPME